MKARNISYPTMKVSPASPLCWLVFIVSVSPLLTQSADADPDLVTAKKFHRENQYLKALKILAPCLKAETPRVYSNLEDCLLFGDEAAEKASYVLGVEYGKVESVVRFEHWPAVLPYKEIGLDLEAGHYGGVIYKHEFLAKLKQLFPKSKYREIYQYRLIQRGENELANVKRWLDELEEYRREFPKGQYYLQATTEAAHVYDNLWEILRPDSKIDYYEWFSSGNRERDTILSEDYRRKALALYEEVMQWKNIRGSRQSEIVDRVRKRYPELVARKEWSTFYILND